MDPFIRDAQTLSNLTTGLRGMPKKLSRMKPLPKGKHVGPKEHQTPKKDIISGTFSIVSGSGHKYLTVTHVFYFPGMFPSEAAAKTAVRYGFFTSLREIPAYSQPDSWIPRGDWGCSADPSGRSVSIHQAAYSAE